MQHSTGLGEAHHAMMTATQLAHPETVLRLIQRNGAAGCSAAWLCAKAGLLPKQLEHQVGSLNARLHPRGLAIVSVAMRYFLMDLEAAEIELEFKRMVLDPADLEVA